MRPPLLFPRHPHPVTCPFPPECVVFGSVGSDTPQCLAGSTFAIPREPQNNGKTTVPGKPWARGWSLPRSALPPAGPGWWLPSAVSAKAQQSHRYCSGDNHRRPCCWPERLETSPAPLPSPLLFLGHGHHFSFFEPQPYSVPGPTGSLSQPVLSGSVTGRVRAGLR